MSSHALAEVLAAPGLSDSYFRLLVFLAECSCEDDVESSLDWLAAKVRMPVNEVRMRIRIMGEKLPDRFLLVEKDELVIEGTIAWSSIRELRA